MKIILTILFIIPLLYGCPLSDGGKNCNKVMYCEDDREMLCEPLDSGCGEVCSYFVYEHCYERCEKDMGL
tara:strand:+ start:229 stop:438 length:210 start_codon:yes stop_codon:yes gene_type:complete